MKKIAALIFLLLISFLFPSAAGQESVDSWQNKPIRILFPEDGVTYGPWSDTYIDYPRTGGKAHHIRVRVSVGEEVAYYRMMRNNELVQYIGNVSMEDAVLTDAVIDFLPDDLEPLDLVGYLSALQNLSVVAYDADGNEIGRDTAVFYLAVNLDDYYELLASEGEMASLFTVRSEDLVRVAVSQEAIETTSLFYTVKKYITQITVRNKFTDEIEQHTRVRIAVEPASSVGVGRSVDIYSIVPKSLIATVHNMTFAGNYSVLETDPVMMWHFAAVSGPQSVEYDTNLPIAEEDTKAIVPIAVAEIEEDKTGWYYIIPLAIPVILLFGIVYFSRFKKRE